MLTTNGLLEYLAELIWGFSCIDTDQLSSKPLIIAHCVGALKICQSLSINLIESNKIFDSSVLGAVKSFLLTSCSVSWVRLKEEADYVELANARLSLFTPDEEIFFDGGTPRLDYRSYNKIQRYPSSSADRTSERNEMESQNTEPENRQWSRGDLKQTNQQCMDLPGAGRESESGLISPFCVDPTTQGDQIQALIAQVTFEKTFTGDKDDGSQSGGNTFGAHNVTESAKVCAINNISSLFSPSISFQNFNARLTFVFQE